MKGDNYISLEGKKRDAEESGFVGVVPKERNNLHELRQNLRDIERPWPSIRKTPNLPRRESVEELRQDMIRMSEDSKS